MLLLFPSRIQQKTFFLFKIKKCLTSCHECCLFDFYISYLLYKGVCLFFRNCVEHQKTDAIGGTCSFYDAIDYYLKG